LKLTSDTDVALKLSGMACFHLYISQQDLIHLAKARSEIHAKQSKEFFENVRDSYLHYVERSLEIKPSQKSRIRWQFEFVESFEAGGSIELLSSKAEKEDYTSISDLVSRRGQHLPPFIELASIRAQAIEQRFSNKQLDRMWHLALTTKNYDFAWRCLALLKQRQALANDLADRYRSSVERKSLSFAMVDPCEYLEALSYGFEGDERAFLVALVRVGQLLPELLSFVNKQVVQVKQTSSKLGVVQEIETYLETNSAFYGFNRKYRWIHRSAMDGFEIDELLGDSVWCRLVEFLVVAYGFDAWSWQ